MSERQRVSQPAPVSRSRWWPAASLAVGALVMSACTSTTSSPSQPPSTVVSTHTEVITPSTPPVPSLATVPPLPPGATPPAGQTETSCRYIASGQVENIVGSHVYRTTVDASGCRFFFYSSPYNALADVTVTRYASATDATYVMTHIAVDQGTEVSSQPNLAAGASGALFRGSFLSYQPGRYWSCVFAKGTLVVVVRTQRTDNSQYALDLAQALAPAL